jgi:hypothetical protein
MFYLKWSLNTEYFVRYNQDFVITEFVITEFHFLSFYLNIVISADRFDLLWLDLLKTRLKRVFSITRQLNF